MSMDRRQFLKFAGISSILGIGATAVAKPENPLFTGLTKGVDTNKEALTAKHWAMVVDMTKFTSEDDIKKVVAACHTNHNVPDFGNDIKHEIKWIWKEAYGNAFPNQENPYMSEHVKEMPFLVLCNHCEKPACVRVCPTQATFKRTQDGIVMMDMHRCIGCRFCMAACPYGARSFNYFDPRTAPNLQKDLPNKEYPTRTKGVVEKCTFCTERLAVGKMPYCVEAAPKGALFFGDLEDKNSEVRKIVETRYTIRRKPEVGTGPSVYYLIGGNEHA